MQAEDAGDVVFEDRNLIRAKFHARTVWCHVAEGKDLCRSNALRSTLQALDYF
jgi:hypothetical protein